MDDAQRVTFPEHRGLGLSLGLFAGRNPRIILAPSTQQKGGCREQKT
jgi:hypothetical protein